MSPNSLPTLYQTSKYSEAEWWALLDHAFPCSKALRARVADWPREAAVTQEPLSPDSSLSSDGLSSELLSTEDSEPLSPWSLEVERFASEAHAFHPACLGPQVLGCDAVALVDALSPKAALERLQALIPHHMGPLRHMLVTLESELADPKGAEEQEWVLVPAPETVGAAQAARQTGRTGGRRRLSAHAIASAVAGHIRLGNDACEGLESHPGRLQWWAPAAFERLMPRQHLPLASLAAPLRTLCPARRSGSALFQTADRQLILKRISAMEKDKMVDIAEAYVNYLLQFPTSLLCRILGCYTLHLGGRDEHFLLMQAGFPPQLAFAVVYDLKGSTANRGHAHPSTSGGPRPYPDVEKELKDNDLRVPIELETAEQWGALHGELERDSQFLCSHGLYDYSLLVAVAQAPIGLTPQLSTSTTPTLKWQCDNDAQFFATIVDFLTPWTVPLGRSGVRVPTRRSLTYLVSQFLRPGASTMPPAPYQARFLREVMLKFSHPSTPSE